MNEVAVSEARSRLAEIIEETNRSGEPYSITRRQTRVAVLIDAESFDKIVEAAEDAIDLKEVDAARAENDYIPWDEVKAMLGLN